MSRLRAIARGTVAISDQGSYSTGAGTVPVAEAIARAVAGTRLHLPDEVLDTDELNILTQGAQGGGHER